MPDFISQILEMVGNHVSPWIYGPAAFILWVLALGLVKSIFFARLKTLSQKTSSRLDDVFITSAKLPVSILILGSGVYLLQTLLPLGPKILQVSSGVAQGSIVLGIVLFLDRFVREFLTLYGGRIEFGAASKEIIRGLTRGLVIGLGLLVFLDMLGISITPVLASLGIGSLAVALALQDTLTNFFAGIYINIDKPLHPGQFVKLESGEEGYVTEVGWRSTRIRMLPNNVVIVPNQKIISSVITNYYLPDTELAVLVQVGVHYDSDLKKVEDVTVDVAREIMKKVQGGVPSFEPFIRYHTFDSSSINFTVILRAREFVDNYLIKHEFIKALHERYKREGIAIPYPLRTLDIPKEMLELIKSR